MLIFLICFGAFLFSIFVTWQVRLYSLRKAIFDIPNERSSHVLPTPRGGGIGIVLTFTVALIGLRWQEMVNSNLFWALSIGGIAIAIMGYIDDVKNVKARWRILLHFSSALWALYWLGGCSSLTLGTQTFLLHGSGSFLTIIAIVWSINFYNFMDGIDGLAGSEGIFIGVTSAIALGCLGVSEMAIIMSLLSAAIAGFTVWNWPPAKIFLGDVGSGFLGYVFAVCGLYTVNQHTLPIYFWLILVAVFLCDATFTLVYRAYQKKPLYSAHRDHAYQTLISWGANHKQVTLSILLFNIGILMPLAFLGLFWPAYSVALLMGLFVTMMAVWSWIKFI